VIGLINLNQRKIIDYEVVAENWANSLRYFDGSGNGLEIEALKRMTPRGSSGPSIVSDCHDNDSKTRKRIRDPDWKIQEYIHSNHILKAVERKLKKDSRPLFSGIGQLLKLQFQCLVSSDLSIDA